MTSSHILNLSCDFLIYSSKSFIESTFIFMFTSVFDMTTSCGSDRQKQFHPLFNAFFHSRCDAFHDFAGSHGIRKVVKIVEIIVFYSHSPRCHLEKKASSTQMMMIIEFVWAWITSSWSDNRFESEVGGKKIQNCWTIHKKIQNSMEKNY